MTHKHTYDKEIIVCSECYAEGVSESTIKSLRDRLEKQKSKIARLRKELGAAEAFHKVAVKERDYEREVSARLREAIRREAERHSKLTFYIDGAIVRCPCEVCLIAREGR